MAEDTLARWQREDRPRWPWVWPLTIALIVPWLLAPRIEAALWPVFGRQALEDVTRTADRLCWERVVEKLRAPAVQNYDAFLDRPSPTGSGTVHSFPEIFGEAPPHEPVSTDTAPGRGWSRRRLCIGLPPSVRPGQPLRLRQTVHFRGWLGLWDLPVPLPTITDPPGAALPD